jgi:hypothetical protein
MAKANQIYKQSNGRMIKEPSQLPEIQDMLRVAAGGEERPMDVNEIFMRGVEQSLSGQK